MVAQVQILDNLAPAPVAKDFVEDDVPATVYDYDESPENKSWACTLPTKKGLYDPEYEKDACGVGFSCNIKGEKIPQDCL